MGWLEQQEFTSPQFCLEIQIKVLLGLIASKGLSLWLADGSLPLVSSHGLHSVRASVFYLSFL